MRLIELLGAGDDSVWITIGGFTNLAAEIDLNAEICKRLTKAPQRESFLETFLKLF